MQRKTFKSPDHLFGELFVDLHLSGIWADGKVISDSTPLFDIDVINESYKVQKNESGFDLKKFFENNFDYFSIPTQDFVSDKNMSVVEHISVLWNHLSRSSDKQIKGSSLIPLPNKYVVPGGRFNEIYYWDSYFTMLGLVEADNIEMVESMIDNFAWQINNFGFIPNGNRSYFLGRSQPPFFSLMVSLLAEQKGESIYFKYFDCLLKEHGFWMSHDQELLATNGSDQHVVRLNNSVLNRYYDKFDSPRPEMYGDDIKLSQTVLGSEHVLFSNLRSACESGWDFSSRWLKDDLDLSSIHTLDILPLDLNCLIYNLELVIAKAARLIGSFELETKYTKLSSNRKQLIEKLFWDIERQFFFDYNHKNMCLTKVESLVAVFPLFFRIADAKQAKSVADKIESDFLKDGGVLTTTINSGQQWDAPNGWAPLQYITVVALKNYGFIDLANTLKYRWLTLNERVFKNTGKMLEKYNVVDVNLLSGGGEYPVQDGFGWTNGVYLKLYKME